MVEMVDVVEHRGVKAFQSIFGDSVTIIKPGERPAHVQTDGFKDVDEIKGIIEHYLESR